MNKKIIIPIIVVLALAFGAYQVFFKKEAVKFETAQASKATVVQEVSETGQVQKGDKIALSFEQAGKIEKIYVKIGDKVEQGASLAKIETADLFIQLQEANAALNVAQSRLDKLLAGASKEEIDAARTRVENSRIALNTASQGLSDAEEDYFNVLDDVYLKAYNAKSAVDSVQLNYFNGNDQEGILVREQKVKIGASVVKISALMTEKDTAVNFSKAKAELDVITNGLKVVRDACESLSYRGLVSATDKTSLDTHRTYVSAALVSLTTASQAIGTQKLAVEAARGTLKTTEDSFALLTAEPRMEDVALYQAQVDQVKYQMSLLSSRMNKSVVRSPVKGQVSEIKKRVGELVQPTSLDYVISLLPEIPFEIKANIYEEDVVKIEIGNEVTISFIAMPGKEYKGKVVSIEPTEKTIDGVIYYETIIAFDSLPEGIKPGMTADIVVRTMTKDNVLSIPSVAIQNKDGKNIVEVFDGTETNEKEVAIGLIGSNDLTEIVSGLSEGDKVVIR